MNPDKARVEAEKDMAHVRGLVPSDKHGLKSGDVVKVKFIMEYYHVKRDTSPPEYYVTRHLIEREEEL